jgi:hypothetical protein
MNPTDPRLRRDLHAARYLDALERNDFDTAAALWRLALADPELESALREVHAGLIEEQAREATASAEATLTAAVEAHLPSAEVIRPAGPVTAADVADELFRHPPNRLPAAAHALNEKLRTAAEPLPPNLGLPQLTAWAESLFGSAPPEYWKAFRQAAVKLELRRAAEAEYQMAARRAPRPEDKP